MPPTEGDGDGDGGGSGWSSRRQLAVVVGGLLAVAGGLSALTFLYWRRTRPVPYNAALDALGDLAGPAPLAPGSTAVAGEPTVITPPVTAPVSSRTPDQAAALLAALVAAEEGALRRPEAPGPASASISEGAAPDGAAPALSGASAASGDVPGDAPGASAAGVAPIEPGGPGFRVMGAVAATAAGAESDRAMADPTVEAAPAPDPASGSELHEFVTREDLESPSSTPEPPVVVDPLSPLLSENDPGPRPPGSPGPVGS